MKRIALSFILLGSLLFLAGQARAKEPLPDNEFEKGVEIEEVEEVEEIEEVEEVVPVDSAQAATSSAHTQDMSWAKLLGRLHPALVHFPIAWLVLALLLKLAWLLSGKTELRTCTLVVLALGVASLAPAAISGFLRADEFSQPSQGLFDHRNMMIISGALALLVLISEISLRKRQFRLLSLCNAAGLGAAVALLAWGAHLGGVLVFGDRYLPF